MTSTRTDGDPSNDIAVANMSLAGPGSDDGHCGTTDRDAVHMAICNSIAAGVTYVVAAGNESKTWRAYFRRAYSEVLTVTAMNDCRREAGGVGGSRAPVFPMSRSLIPDDKAAYFSNFATLPADRAHTVAAPGVCIFSTDLTTAAFTGYVDFSGTSQATPHVAGTVALCIASGRLRRADPSADHQEDREPRGRLQHRAPGLWFHRRPDPAQARESITAF